ncbi:MAG: phosphoribosyl-AMP cyclohydrolase [Gammaproteobacteria bacterium]
MFKELESAKVGASKTLAAALDQLAYNEDGLLPAVAQQHDSGQVLTLAWMNRAAIEETLATGRVCYWSRSRQVFWRKGESSGHIQKLKELRIDCDGDSLLLLVDQTGPACHTGRQSCFYLGVRDDRVRVLNEVLVDPREMYATKDRDPP